jgi:ABC-type branched-subunit amino acid transport system ATPase component
VSVREDQTEVTAVASLRGKARQLVGLGEPKADRSDSELASVRFIVALGCIAAGDQLITTLLAVLSPEIRAALGLSVGSFGLAVAQRANVSVLAAIALAAASRRWPRHRGTVATAVAAATACGVALAALSSSFWPLFASLGLSSGTAAAVWALHRPMVVDASAPSTRARNICWYQAGPVAGAALVPVVLLVLSDGLGANWRALLLACSAALAAVAVVGARWCRVPAPGELDERLVRAEVRGHLGAGDAVDGAAEVEEQHLMETFRRLLLVSSVRRLLAAFALLGVVLSPLLVYAAELVEYRWRLGVEGRAWFIGGAWAMALPVLVWYAPRAQRALRTDLAQLLGLASRAVVVLAGALLVFAVVPVEPIAWIALGAVLAAASVLVPTFAFVLFATVRAEDRAPVGALSFVLFVVIGGQGGATVLGGVGSRFGPAVALVVLGVVALGATRLVRTTAVEVDADVDQVLGEVLESEEVAVLRQRGTHVAMLACRGINFSYGRLQVLFDIDFTVDDGEMVALLGTNGAGKSTLLRVVSGLGLPQRGTVRFLGRDITYIDAERRVRLGISQVPGGRAVYGPLTVLDNLRVLGFTHDRNRKAVDAGIEAAFDAFPRLAERRDQLASTLSGGEQQMLGLSTALIVRPRLLLIDELSLGLAPKVVGELLDMLRVINEQGTAIVLVEQSVNIALSVVHHAYFMEKGEIRFDGASKDLLSRPDLLRSVFLEGASQGIAASNGRG